MSDARARLGANTRDQAIAIFITRYGMPGNLLAKEKQNSHMNDVNIMTIEK